MEKYEIAIDYFQTAIAMDINDQLERSKAHLYLLRIYNKKRELDLAKQYVDLIKRSLPNITYSHTVKEIYEALAEYYKQSGDYKQALQYSDLEYKTMEQIQKEKQIPKLLAVDKNVHMSQKEKEIDKLLKYKQYIRYIEELF